MWKCICISLNYCTSFYGCGACYGDTCAVCEPKPAIFMPYYVVFIVIIDRLLLEVADIISDVESYFCAVPVFRLDEIVHE